MSIATSVCLRSPSRLEIRRSLRDRQAREAGDGSVVVRSGETMLLATAVGRAEAREGADFFR